MLSKITLSLATAIALTAAGAARANPMPTSTDEARALAGQVTAHEQIYAVHVASDDITSTDAARAEAGQSLPASSGAWVAPTIAKNEDEGRAAAFSNPEAQSAREPVATGHSGAGMTEQGN
jgi:hypothetical protein